MDQNDEVVARIRELNDDFRRSMNPSLGRVVVTQGVASLSELYRIAAIQKVRFFEDFTEANDPHGEHDFGAFSVGEEKLFFTIDYYDRDMEAGSEDPADPEKTMRVLTLMRSCEY